MRFVLVPFCCASVASVSSTLLRAEMPYRGSIIATLNQSRNGATCWVIPMALDFACIICHTVDGPRKGDTISGWTRERGTRDVRGTDTLYVLGVSWGRQGFLGTRRANKASISAAWGTVMSDGLRYSG